MSTQIPTTAPVVRINVLAIVGSSLIVAGLYSAFTIWSSMFGRYMYVEDLDLGMSEEAVFAVTKITPADKGLLIVAAILVVLGLVAIISAIVRAALRRKDAASGQSRS